jgi:hypothetical protein
LRVEALAADATYTGNLTEPAVPLLEWLKLYEVAYRTFSPWVRPDGIKWDGRSSHPADLLVNCNLLPINAIVSFRLNNIEIFGRYPLVDPTDVDWPALVGKTAHVVRVVSPDTTFSSHHFALFAHYRLQDATVAEWLAHWAKPPDGLQTGSVSFTIKEEVEQGLVRVSLDLQPSLGPYEGPHNLFTRASCALPGAVDPAAACEEARTAIVRILKAADIETTAT